MPVCVSPGSGGGDGMAAPVIPSAAGFVPHPANNSSNVNKMKRMAGTMAHAVRVVHSLCVDTAWAGSGVTASPAPSVPTGVRSDPLPARSAGIMIPGM
jgi:hypothetical protein